VRHREEHEEPRADARHGLAIHAHRGAADPLHDALRRLARRFAQGPPLNLWIRTAPRGAEHFCWRIDIVPRLSAIAGLELGSGLHLNCVTPEQAASELREA